MQAGKRAILRQWFESGWWLKRALLYFLLIFFLTACASKPRFTDGGGWAGEPSSHFKIGQSWICTTSYYGAEFDGRRTASSEMFDMNKMTAAHPYLPFGTILEVVNLSTGAECRVRVNDRGPSIPGRSLDISYKAAQALGLDIQGVAEVRVTIIELEQQ
ncbi:MAG: septal ring lytic transglycosylase RlpA family protein [Calditrichaeota bacterium]|nr:septal ring lytic transglycosylase RlpA family protein [Calditrichota bacterium]